jgi:hypothetical protein
MGDFIIIVTKIYITVVILNGFWNFYRVIFISGLVRQEYRMATFIMWTLLNLAASNIVFLLAGIVGIAWKQTEIQERRRKS